jgi:hypothetical protein
MGYFVSDETLDIPATDDRKGYSAGSVSKSGIDTLVQTYKLSLLDWYAIEYKYNPQTDKYAKDTPIDKVERRVAQLIYTQEICFIMGADFLKERTFGNWYEARENDKPFYDLCLKLAILQNPVFDLEKAAEYQKEQQDLEEKGEIDTSFLRSKKAAKVAA